MLNGIITSNRGLLPTLGGGAAIFDFTSRVAPDPRITFTRASNATDFSSAGLLTTEGNDVARFDFNPLTLQPRGLLIEGARTNLLLNSATLSTQDITVTAVAHTLSFYGTGSITLSGAATGTLNGAGAFPNRATLTFTPSAGTLTVTVTGSVLNAQCEVGAFASSWIPTTGAAATRAADSAIISNLASIGFNPLEGTILAEIEMMHVSGVTNRVVEIGADVGNRFGIENDTSAAMKAPCLSASIVQSNEGTRVVSPLTVVRAAAAYQQNNFGLAVNGLATEPDTSGLLPASFTEMRIGQGYDANSLFGWLRRIVYIPTRLPNAQLQALTA
jgi:hypothetical protein